MVGIREAFEGARVLVTGSTGFLGTALVAKLLRSCNPSELLLLVRSKPGAPAAERVERRVLGFNAFDDLRARPDWPELAARVRAVDGDMRGDALGLSDEDLASLAGVDYVIHSAATVSFDSPVDEAFETNLAGPLRLLDALRRAQASPKRIVHVSTAYVAGLTKGSVAEGPWTDTPGRPRLDWRAELDVARRQRGIAESQSRSPEILAKLHARAHRELGPAGAGSVASRTEQLRRDWVNDRLVEAGRSRAQSLGWPDAYAFTKSLAETAVLESAQGSFDVCVLRPSIIESSLREPFPGWIRGFRMAEPVILSYGRGTLTQFPGKPDTVIDVVPVDIVVNAILAAAAAPQNPGFLHVSTGNRRPMRYRELVRYTYEYFQSEPYVDEDGQPIYPSMWTFPGRAKVESRLHRATKALNLAAKALEKLPRRALSEVRERLDHQIDELDQAGRYAELYGAYAEVESIFNDSKTRALGESLSESEAGEFAFDVERIDWETYLKRIHLPQVTRRRGAVRTRPREAPKAKAPARRANVLAVFDLEGTILGTNVIDSYLWIRLAASEKGEWLRRIARLAADAPSLLAHERRDRGEFLRTFYRRYEGAPVTQVHALAADAFNHLLLPRCFPNGLRRIREHRAAGHHVVFITGALDFTIAPLAPLADEIAAARMSVRDGRYTGELIEIPLAGDARGTYLRDLAARLGADLRSSYAYGDAISDLPMLESVGNPVCVSPDPRLARVARHRRWAVERWTTEAGAPRFTMPAGSS